MANRKRSGFMTGLRETILFIAVALCVLPAVSIPLNLLIRAPLFILALAPIAVPLVIVAYRLTVSMNREPPRRLGSGGLRKGSAYREPSGVPGRWVSPTRTEGIELPPTDDSHCGTRGTR